MTDVESQWLAHRAIHDWQSQRRALPAWLWTADGPEPVGRSGRRPMFGAGSAAALTGKTLGPADRHRRQIARLVGRLRAGGAMQRERLQGFGAALGELVTCGSSRNDFADGSHGDLIAAGNIPLIAPRPARTEPRRAPPGDRIGGAGLTEPIAQSIARGRHARDRPRRDPLPNQLQPAQSGEAPQGLHCSMRLPNPLLTTARARQRSRHLRPRPSPPPAPHLPIEAFAGQPQTHPCPLRFTWQIDRESRFTLGTDEILQG